MIQQPMFEPEGKVLADLLVIHNNTFVSETKKAENLAFAAFHATARHRLLLAAEAAERCAVCEMALQFEQLAGLS